MPPTSIFLRAAAFGLAALALSSARGVEPTPAPADFRQALVTLAEQARRDPALRERIAPLLVEARRIRDLPVVTRAASLEALKDPAPGIRCGDIDARTWVIQKDDPKKAALFGIAMSDLATANLVVRELPLLAAAYDLTGDRSYLDRIAAQLREMTAWAPLQRPGWSLITAAQSLPPDGDDGVWLATGIDLIAVCQTLEFLPDGALPPDVLQATRRQLADESRRVTGDWKARKGWFVKQHKPITNQWVVPCAGLAAATATLGRDAAPEAYDLAVASLLDTLSSLGSDGAVSEGAGYGGHFTAPYLYLADRFLRRAGDGRLAASPFLKNFPTWMCANFQPGLSMVNSFDCWWIGRNAYPLEAPDVAQLAVLSGSPLLSWLLQNVIRVEPLTAYGLLALAPPPAGVQEPPLWGAFDRACCVMWRDGWSDGASGVWVRGGHALDGHDHWDRGHVNFICRGRIVLMEAGTAGYDSPLKRDRYDSVMGHNVLQVGDDLFPKRSAAPIAVATLDAKGGDVTVEAGTGYPQVTKWERRVVWTADQIEITDRVELKAPDTVLFRWHLASEQQLAISSDKPTAAFARLAPGRISFVGWSGKPPEGLAWTPPATDVVETPGAAISVEADQPIACSQEKDYDHTLKFRLQKHEHTALAVRSAGPVSAITIRTVITVPSL